MTGRVTAMTAFESLNVAIERHGGTFVIALDGELDLGDTHELRTIIGRLEGPCAEMVIDVARLEFIDSTGLHLLVEQHLRARAEGFAFRVAGASGQVARLLETCELDGALSGD